MLPHGRPGPQTLHTHLLSSLPLGPRQPLSGKKRRSARTPQLPRDPGVPREQRAHLCCCKRERAGRLRLPCPQAHPACRLGSSATLTPGAQRGSPNPACPPPLSWAWQGSSPGLPLCQPRFTNVPAAGHPWASAHMTGPPGCRDGWGGDLLWAPQPLGVLARRCCPWPLQYLGSPMKVGGWVWWLPPRGGLSLQVPPPWTKIRLLSLSLASHQLSPTSTQQALLSSPTQGSPGPP